MLKDEFSLQLLVMKLVRETKDKLLCKVDIMSRHFLRAQNEVSRKMAIWSSNDLFFGYVDEGSDCLTQASIWTSLSWYLIEEKAGSYTITTMFRD